MAEKEKRILIKKQINYHPPYGGWCGDGKEIVLTRQEAIERMAKAVYDTFSGCSNITPFEQVEDKYKQGYYKRAEAALNALLEGK